MVFTDEHRKNLSIKRRQRICKPETREKMRKSMLKVHSEKIFGFKKGMKSHSKGKTKDNYEPVKRQSEKMKNKPKSFEHRKKMSANRQGIELDEWVEFITPQIYDNSFTNELKEKIRERDNYECQICNIHQRKHIYKNKKRKLKIHHIDYNKQNSDERNLITLCT